MRKALLLSMGALPILLIHVGCRSSVPEAQADAAVSPAEPVTLTSARAPEMPTPKARMREHDVHGAAVRDAVGRADLDAARREARVLADLRIEGDIDPTWRKKLDAMNAAASRVAEAKDLRDASRGLAALARTCGDCHGAVGGPRPVVGDAPAEGSGVSLHMKRHQWAATELWNGLVVPSDDAWKAGSLVLEDAPLEPTMVTPGKSPAPAIGTLATSVHALARKAHSLQTPADRGAVYAEIMATCASCHTRLGGGSPPPAHR